ncbi:MAG: lysophospholipid acyltransferase family protein [Ectothiorhodospiraceae bacterium]
MKLARAIDRLLRMLAPLPLPLLHGIGSLLGTLALLFPNDARHTARVNVEICFPQWTARRKRGLVRCSLRETAKMMVELSAVWYRSPERVRKLIREVRGAEYLDDAVARGKGVLIAAPHLGSWELLQAWVATRTPLHALYRPPRQAELESLMVRARSRTGAHFHPARGSGVRSLMRALNQGEGVGILPDQQPPEEGVYAPFFGVPAKTMTLFCRFAARSDATPLITWAERLSWGRGYRIHIRPLPPECGDPDPERAAAAMNGAIEEAAMTTPCQYQWTYRRFSRQPQGRHNPYKRYRTRGMWVEARGLRTED